MKKNILTLLLIITTSHGFLHSDQEPIAHHPETFHGDAGMREHKSPVVIDDISEDVSENDFISDFECTSTLDDDQGSLRQRIIDLGKNVGVHILLFMLDARDYFNSYFPTSTTNDNNNAPKR